MPDREQERPAVGAADQAAKQEALPRPARGRKVGVGPPRWLLCFQEVGTLLCAGACLCLAIHSAPLRWWMYVALGIWALAMALGWMRCFTDARYDVMATEDGITWGPLLQRRRKSVRWNEVGGCRVYVDGPGSTAWFGVLDHEGKEMFRVDISGAGERDCDRLVEMVREKQGTRHELLAAGPPAGIGTELEAAQAPAGRGTEPESVPIPEERGRE